MVFGPILLSLAAACGSDSGADPDAAGIPVGNAGAMLDATKAGIAGFLVTAEHRTWVKEAEIHESLGPHSRVRTHFNDKYLEARRTEAFPMPVGAMAVKEIYDGDDVDAYAISIKTREGEGADTWTWYEGHGDADPPWFGVANPTCEGCHKASSRDRSLTPEVP